MAEQIYRIDKFIVPAESRDVFLERVHETHSVLRGMPGFISDFIVEQVGGPGVFNLVTTVIWKDQTAIDYAKSAMHQHHANSRFNPQQFWDQLGIKADLANYRKLDV